VAIDAIEEEINSECARLIALRAPMGSDLRVVLSVIKIAGNLERCGDYAKNLARRSLVLATLTPIAGAGGSLRRMGRQVGVQLKDALDAFIARDVNLAEEVRQRDLDVDQMYNALFREFLTHMMEDPRKISASMHLHFIAKNIERVGDHATSIAEQVIYLATGSLPGDARPKVDGLAGGQNE
jgi:phosphate transport system protein